MSRSIQGVVLRTEKIGTAFYRSEYGKTTRNPCIDAGNGDVAPATDFDGNPRVDDPQTPNNGSGTPGYVDMGAFEYQP
jgi:hypothetical protein